MSLLAQFEQAEEIEEIAGYLFEHLHIDNLAPLNLEQGFAFRSSAAHKFNTAGDFEEFVWLPWSLIVEYAVVEDLNNNGLNEVVVLGAQGNAKKAMVFTTQDGGETYGLEKELDLGIPDFDSFLEPIVSDIDGDGRLEIVVSSGTDLRQIQYTTGSYAFGFLPSIGQSSFINKSPSFLELLDYDGDGNQDILYAIQSFNTFELFIIRGGNNWVSASPEFLSDPAMAVLPGTPEFNGPSLFLDVDVDGDLDLVISSLETKSIHWIENIPGETPRLPVLISPSFENIADNIIGFNTLKKIDLNGDGLMDFVASSMSGINWYRNIGAGEFEEVQLSNKRVFSFDIGRLDGDNRPDMVFGVLDELIIEDGTILNHRFQVHYALDKESEPTSSFIVRKTGNECGLGQEFINTSDTYFPDSSFQWDFGNGTTSTVAHPSFTYESSGAYQVSLEVCNDFGCHTSTKEVVVIVPETNIPDTIPLGEPFLFTDFTPFIENRTWSFGDGNTSSEATVEHSFTFPGVYFLQLFLNTSNPAVCQFVIEKEITVPPLLEDDDGLIVFPNPMTDRCQVIFENKKNKPYRIQIFNNLGQEVFDDQTAEGFLYTFDNKFLIEGVYFIHLTLNGVFIDTKRIIVVEP